MIRTFESKQREPFTKQEQLDNCLLALNLWLTKVKPDQVVENLTAYTQKTDCGTLHCFGGWIAEWPEFQALGVFTDDYSVQLSIRGAEDVVGLLASSALFGTEKLFGGRGFCNLEVPKVGDSKAYYYRDSDHRGLADWDLVVYRLKAQIQILRYEVDNLPKQG